MTFISPAYLLIFLPAIVILYSVFRTSWLANLFILGFSYYFYGSSAVWFLVPLVVTSLVDYYVGQTLDVVEAQKWRKVLLFVSLGANLGLLAFFKYTPWLIESINSA